MSVCAPLLLTAVTTESAAAATDNSTLVYLKAGRVWIAHTDGSGAHAVTKAAYHWASPSQDDNGNIVVLGGLPRVNADGSDSDGSSDIYRFRPDGNQIGKPIPTWGSYSTPSCPYYPPTNLRVSPDGSKVAYGILECASFEYTALWTPTSSTGLNFPNQDIGQLDFYQPSWIDNSTFAISHFGSVFSNGANWGVHNVNDGDNVGSGWHEDGITGTSQVAVISRDGTTSAVFEDDAADYTDGVPRHVNLWLYHAASLADASDNGYTLDCTIPLDASKTTDPQHLSPSISADGKTLYWGDDAGIEAAQITDRSNSCASVQPTLVIPGGSQPFAGNGGIAKLAAEPIQPGAAYPPHPSFRVKPAHPRAKKVTSFDAGASHETMGRIVTFAWNFGDHKTGKGKAIGHKYAKRGTYAVKLTVTDKRGVKRSLTHKVKVT